MVERGSLLPIIPAVSPVIPANAGIQPFSASGPGYPSYTGLPAGKVGVATILICLPERQGAEHWWP